MSIEAYLENQLFQLTVEASPAGMLMVDADGRIVLVNAQALEWFGYRREELLGRPVESLVPVSHRDAHARHRAQFQRADSTRPLVNGRNLSARRKDGTELPVDISLHPIDTPAGRLVLANILDASQRQRAEQIPNERLAAIGEMVSGLAHECRNALQRARACLDLLELDLNGQPDQLDLAARIRRAIEDLERNYETVSDYAAPLHLERKEVDIAQVIREAYDDIRAATGPLHLKLKFMNRQAHSTISIDRFRMKQVFRNLLENSLAACDKSGEIIAQIKDSEINGSKWQQVTILDSGSGIPIENRGRVFEPFFTTKQTGTGLGLSICRRIIEAHGGTIALREMPRDCGTAVEINVPLVNGSRPLNDSAKPR